MTIYQSWRNHGFPVLRTGEETMERESAKSMGCKTVTCSDNSHVDSYDRATKDSVEQTQQTVFSSVGAAFFSPKERPYDKSLEPI